MGNYINLLTLAVFNIAKFLQYNAKKVGDIAMFYTMLIENV